MSNDLISRGALMEGRVENDPVRIAAMCAPTAFDKEKVIEELIAGRFIYAGEDVIGECTSIGINKAIRIVEKGGIE